MKTIRKHKWLLNAIGTYLLVLLLLMGTENLYYRSMPVSWFIDLPKDGYHVEGVCKTERGNHTLLATTEREIYPWLPDALKLQRSIPAKATLEITRAGREIDRINTGEFSYQFVDGHIVELSNELRVVLLPGQYQSTAYITLLIPTFENRPQIIRKSNTFTVPETVAPCE